MHLNNKLFNKKIIKKMINLSIVFTILFSCLMIFYVDTTKAEPPIISNVYYVPTIPASDYPVTIYATVNDVDGLSSVTIYWNDGTNHSKAMTKESTSGLYSANIGQYDKDTTITYYINATNNLTNSNQSDEIFFTVKSPEPTIIIENPETNSVIYNKKPTIKAYYDDLVGINLSSIVFKLDNKDITNSSTIVFDGIIYNPTSELALGSHTVSLEVSDTLNNISIKTWSFTIYESTSSTQIYTGEIKTGYVKEIIINNGTNDLLGINKIYIDASKNLEKTNLFIAKSLTISDEITEPKITESTIIIGAGYSIIDTQNLFISSYLDIEFTSNGSKVKETDIDSITIYFKIEKSWIENNNIDKESIKLLRYKDYVWYELTTTYNNEDDNYVYYNAVTKGLSTFAIIGLEKIIEKESDGINILLNIGIIIAAIIIIIAFLFKKGYLYIEDVDEK